MDNILFWRYILWGTPIIAGVLMFVANTKITKLNELKDKEKSIESEKKIEKHESVYNGNVYNISSENQSGGFTGVVNNNIDDLQQTEVLQLLNEFKKNPSKYSTIYDRWELLPIKTKDFPKFKILIDLTHKFDKENLTEEGYSKYNIRERTIPFLLKHFPKQLYEDISLDKEFNLCSQLQNFSNDERKHLIKVLNNVTNESSIEMHKYAIKSMLIDLACYSPELLPFFANEFGNEKLKKIRLLWSASELEDVYQGHKELFFKYGIL